MGNRRFAPTSDDEDSSPPHRSSIGDEKRSQRKRKKVHIPDDDEEIEMDEPKLSKEKNKNTNKKKKIEDPVSDSDDDDQEDAEAHPLGETIRVSGKGRGRRNHYASFEYDGLQYELEDPVLLVPEGGDQNLYEKPYVAIIKDISQTREGALMVTGQWFYRPEEAQKKKGGNWQSSDTRELFYSFHRDEVPAESVMHKCVVHFIPLDKQIPRRKQHPGFIVQKVYDTELRRLFKLTDKDYEEDHQHEINILVQKTVARIGDLLDLEPDNANAENENQIKSKRLMRKKNVSHLDISLVNEGLNRAPSKIETPGSAFAGGPTGSEHYAVFLSFKALTGESQRDRWLVKLFESIQFACTPGDSKQNDVEELDGNMKEGNESYNKGADTAVSAIAALEKCAHDLLSVDFLKYNQKMRQLSFNLKGNNALARRLLNKELEPAQILNMAPNELKEGLTAEELASRQPEKSGHMQMTDATCKRCSQRQVALLGMFQAGHGDRYQLECVPCGNTWYASRDDVAELTLEGPNTAGAAKFEDVEKNVVSPKGDEKGEGDSLGKPRKRSL